MSHSLRDGGSGGSVSSKVGEDECSEWTTLVSKNLTKRKLSKIRVEDTCMNDNSSFHVGMRLLNKDAYVGDPFEVSNCEYMCWEKQGV